MSTKAILRGMILREARVKSAGNLNTLVDDIVADIMRDYCNKARYYELLQENIPITVIAGQQSYVLPDDFQNLSVVKYGRGPNPCSYRIVDPQPETVSQTWSQGLPRFYRLVAGPKLSLFPYGQIVIQDQILIDYYVDPASLYTTDSSNFPIPRLESAVKKDAIARLQRFYSAIPESQAMDADAAASYIASQSASK